MANLTFRRAPYVPARSFLGFDGWDPFRLMEGISRFDSKETAFAPAFEVRETDKGYLFVADVPGVKEGDLEISVNGNILTVSGKREAEHKDETKTYFAYERTYGSFVRNFSLPDTADTGNIAADLKEGVLTLLVPRKPEAQPRKISVGKG